MLPPDIAGVASDFSPRSLLARSLNWSDADSAMALPRLETQNRVSPAQTGEPKNVPPGTRSCQIVLPLAQLENTSCSPPPGPLGRRTQGVEALNRLLLRGTFHLTAPVCLSSATRQLPGPSCSLGTMTRSPWTMMECPPP